MSSFKCCGRPRLSEKDRAEYARMRTEFLRRNGPQMAATFDYIYGYGTANACGSNVSYYRQFDAANGEQCEYPHYADREQQIDQYRGLNCRQLRGWDRRMQHPLAGCCSYYGSCNGTLPYPYAQAQLATCDPETAPYAGNGCSQHGCGGCGEPRPRYTWALDEPKHYPHTPYPAAYYMQSQWPYGAQPPTVERVEAARKAKLCKPKRHNVLTSCKDKK